MKWEYRVEHPFGYICTSPLKEDRAKGETGKGNIEAYFDNLGFQGWELCGIDDTYGYFFKRKVQIVT